MLTIVTTLGRTFSGADPPLPKWPISLRCEFCCPSTYKRNDEGPHSRFPKTLDNTRSRSRRTLDSRNRERCCTRMLLFLLLLVGVLEPLHHHEGRRRLLSLLFLDGRLRRGAFPGLGRLVPLHRLRGRRRNHQRPHRPQRAPSHLAGKHGLAPIGAIQ